MLGALALAGYLTDWRFSRSSESRDEGTVSHGAAHGAGTSADKAKDQAVRLASREAVDKSGIQVAAADYRAMTQFVEAAGTIDYDRTRLARLSTRVPGHVWHVYKQVGAPVRKGEVLGLIDAAEVGRAKGEFLQAFRLLKLRLTNLEQQQRTAAAISERQLRESEAAVAESRIRLFHAQQALANFGLPIPTEQLDGLSDEQLTHRMRFFGLPESVTASLGPETTTANLLPLAAPFDGLVIRCDAVKGEVVGSAQAQFVVADVSRLWVFLDVRQEDVDRVRRGQRITFRPDGPADLEAAGLVSWISTEVDDKTRTVPVRAEVSNLEGRLRAHSFGTGRIVTDEKPNAITVPSEAVQWNGSDPLVFVRRSDSVSFEPRRIRVGFRNQDHVEVVEGIRAGEVVATTGSHLLKSEIFRRERENRDD